MTRRRPLNELNDLFKRLVTARQISENLMSFDGEQETAHVVAVLEELGFDFVGIRKRGRIVGWARRRDLTNGLLAEHVQRFSSYNTVPENASLVRVVKRLANTPAIFLTVLGDVGAIVTRSDLQKTPVRLWLFGLVSLLEMRLLDEIREEISAGRETVETICALLRRQRVLRARELFGGLRRKNVEIDLLECFQFSDKAKVASKCNAIRTRLGFSDINSCSETLTRLVSLRNAAAHVRSPDPRRWKKTLSLAEHAERLLGLN